MKAFASAVTPVLAVVLVIVAAWYLGAALMNRQWVLDQAARAGTAPPGGVEMLAETWSQDRPVLPAPHQVVAELWKGVTGHAVTSRRSLVYHGWVTLSATLLGFGIGTVMGIALAVGIVHNRAMDLGVMPWAIASQTIPILAIAPMFVVVMNSMGLQGLLPKAAISAWLSFFPVVVGMVKGLRAPEPMQLDLLRTWNASGLTVLTRLRLPTSMAWLFASLKVAAAAALVGAIVGELPTGAVAGLGARLLQGSYYGQTVQIWAALFGAAILAAGLVALIGLAERLVLRRMGLQR
ncbi:ABC transporter permease [Pseudogemmobacter sonorensis]|uniref:ABC transporter permease n=1 Tax=Pseudogemmobacter sonorensis TaxID=2989681 RepID=UPI003682A449